LHYLIAGLGSIGRRHLKNIKTIFTRHGHREIEKDGGMLLKWWGDCIQYGTKDWDNCVRGIVKVEG